MKKVYLIVLLLFAGLGVQNSVQAQARKNIVKINPLSLGILTLNGSYERVVSERISLQMGVFYTNISFQGTSFTGLGLTPEVRVYLSTAKGGAPEGWYLSPFFRYQNLTLTAVETVTDSRAMADITAKGGGVVVGHQWLLGKAERVSLDLFIGPKYDKGDVVVEGNASEETFYGLDTFSGFWIRSGLTLGVAF